MYTLLKSQAGSWPEPTIPAGIDLALEASHSRQRMYPVTVIYSSLLVAVLAAAWRTSHLPTALAFAALGVAAWTVTEYAVHRWVLHVAFPPGRSWTSRVLHALFDAAHVDHHAQPWDGYHINGYLDTLLVAVWLVPLSFLAPAHTAPVAVAALFAGYLAEEWAHHAMHFRNFRWRYFQYVRRRHLYHHSRHGVGTAYGITSDLFDKVFGTRIPLPQRARLFPARVAASVAHS
ncbi:MAG TPA: sterol desaturase family protein [Vicinamibacteria bacterium]|nr:sterol desaturase family protein [Vicinamibacteria bacterium]